MRRVIIDGEKKDGYSSPYDAICGAYLPSGLDPHTAPSDELSASLGLHVHVYGSGVPTGARDSPRARFAHFLYLGKIIALLVRKILWTRKWFG